LYDPRRAVPRIDHSRLWPL